MHLVSRAYSCAPLLLALATLGWAGNTIAGKLAVGHISPMLLIFLRWGMVVLLLLPLAAKDIRAALPLVCPRALWLLGVGASITLFNGLFYWAARHTAAINLGILQSMIPVFILAGACAFYGERAGALRATALALTVAGCAAVASDGDWHRLAALAINFGDFLMLIACLFYATYALGLRNRPPIAALAMMWFIALAAWLATIPLALLEAALGQTQAPTAAGWRLLLYIALIPSLLSQVFFMRGVDLIGAARAGLFANLVPVFSAFLAVALLNEAPRAHHFIALALVAGGIFLFERDSRRKNRVESRS